MIALAKIGRMAKTSRLPQIGMKVLNTLMVVVTQDMVAASKVIKVNSLNLFLVGADNDKVVVADRRARA
jgi:hypothetical protein